MLGTSHRQAPVKALVGDVRRGLRDLFGLPEGYEIVLGNGGSTAFWDVAAFGLMRERASTSRSASSPASSPPSRRAAPLPRRPATVVTADPGTRPPSAAEDGVDVYA